MNFFVVSILFIYLCFKPVLLLAEDDIKELILPNGLKVIVKPDHRTPTVVLQIWYKVGSADEVKGSTGISHLLEHMMFFSSQNILMWQSFNQLSRVGALGNAYTERDYSYYYHILGKQYLALALQLEASRMAHLSPVISEFNTERKVVWEEIYNRIGKEPIIPAYNKLYELAFKNQAYQFPVIGRVEDLENLTLAKIMTWYNSYYSPDNAVLVVVGDIKASDVFLLAEKYFTAIKKTKVINKPRHFAKTASKKTKVRYVMSDAKKAGALLLAYRVPSINTSIPQWQAYALEVVAGWFESGRNSRLSRVLIKEQKLASAITVSYASMSKKETLFIIEALPAQGVLITELEQALVAEIAAIKTELIAPDDLQKIKNQMLATEIFDRDSLFTQAKIIGQAEAIGIHWSDDAQYIARINNVSAEQLKKVLQQYFIADNEVIVIQRTQKSTRKKRVK